MKSNFHAKIIGLTGGIGCGKTTVTRYLKSQGVKVIDADKIAHNLLLAGSPIVDKIKITLGSYAFEVNGQLNRQKLGRQVFNDTNALKQLEAILHPHVRTEIEEQITDYQQKKMDSPYLVVDIPLLFEKKYDNFFDEIVVVDCLPLQQIERVLQRDGTDEKIVLSIMKKQLNRNKRLQYADIILDNTKSIDQLINQVKHLHHQFS